MKEDGIVDETTDRLWEALESDNWEEVEPAIEAGADLMGTRYGDTPLHFAARNCTHDAMSVLLAYYDDPNIRNAEFQTPLHIAVDGHPEVTQLLVEDGADLIALDGMNRTPLWLATATASEDKSTHMEILLRAASKTWGEISYNLAASEERADISTPADRDVPAASGHATY